MAIGTIILGMVCIPYPVGAETPQGAFSESISRVIPREALWSLMAVDLATGKETIHAGMAANYLLVPGSLMKLITTGAWLHHTVGHGTPDMSTTLSSDGMIRNRQLFGNLYLTGRGNALFSFTALRDMARELSRLGVIKINGDIVLDATAFDVRGLERKRKGAAQAAPGALGFDLHTVAVIVSSTQTGKPPKVRVEPVNPAVRVAVGAMTTDAAANTIQIAQLDDLSYSITGNIPTGAGSFRHRFPLSEPATYVGGTLRTILQENGISVSGEVKSGKAPAAATRLAEVTPPDLDVLLRDMNMHSLNVVADNLLLLLGAQKFGAPGTQEKGLLAVNDFLAGLGFSTVDAIAADGSGLRDENRATVGFFAKYLWKASAQPWFDTFYASLPRAGVDGTLRGLEFVDERFRVKTGVLEDAYALAGYGADRGGRRFSFAFIVNYPGCGITNINKVGAAVMRLLSTEVF